MQNSIDREDNLFLRLFCLEFYISLCNHGFFLQCQVYKIIEYRLPSGGLNKLKMKL